MLTFEIIAEIIYIAATVLFVLISMWVILRVVLYVFTGAMLQFAWTRKNYGLFGVFLFAVGWAAAPPLMIVWALAWRWYGENPKLFSWADKHEVKRRYED